MDKFGLGMVAAFALTGVASYGAFVGIKALNGEQSPPLETQSTVITAVKSEQLVAAPVTVPAALNTDKNILGLTTRTEPKPAQAVPPRGNGLVRKWEAPCDAGFKTDDLLNPSRIEDVVFDRAGERLVTVSKRDVICWDTATGRSIHTFTAKDRHHPVVSRDARFVAISSDTEVSIYETSTGNLAGKHQLTKEGAFMPRWTRACGAFSPSGELLLMATTTLNETKLLAIASRTGKATQVRLGKAVDSGRFDHEQIEPIPDSINVLINGRVGKPGQGKPAPVVSLNLDDDQSRPLTAMKIKPWSLRSNRGMRLSNDGKKLIAHDHEMLMVVDRLSDRELFSRKEDKTQLSDPVFTPDGERCLFLRHPHYYVIDLSAVGTRQYPSDSVELCDAKTGRQLGSIDTGLCGFEKRLTTFEISHDGKLIAVAAGTKLALFDFTRSFGLKPLAPVSLPKTAENYPSR